MGKHKFRESTNDTGTEGYVFRVCALNTLSLPQEKPTKTHL